MGSLVGQDGFRALFAVHDILVLARHVVYAPAVVAVARDGHVVGVERRAVLLVCVNLLIDGDERVKIDIERVGFVASLLRRVGSKKGLLVFAMRRSSSRKRKASLK